MGNRVFKIIDRQLRTCTGDKAMSGEWPGGPCPQCGDDMPAKVIHCQTCRTSQFRAHGRQRRDTHLLSTAGDRCDCIRIAPRALRDMSRLQTGIADSCQVPRPEGRLQALQRTLSLRWIREDQRCLYGLPPLRRRNPRRDLSISATKSSAATATGTSSCRRTYSDDR